MLLIKKIALNEFHTINNQLVTVSFLEKLVTISFFLGSQTNPPKLTFEIIEFE